MTARFSTVCRPCPSGRKTSTRQQAISSASSLRLFTCVCICTVPDRGRERDRRLIALAKIITPSIASWISDRWGRRICLLIGSVISVAGALINTFATGRGMLIGGRAVLGAGLGMHATVAPPMVQEICHPVRRPRPDGELPRPLLTFL